VQFDLNTGNERSIMKPTIDTYKKAARFSLMVPYLNAFKRRPINTIVLSAAAIGLPFINAAGVAGATGFAFPLCLPIGGLMLAKQVEALLDWRNRRGSRLKSATVLAGISAINMVSIAAGFVAYDADALGQRMIARQLNPIVTAARSDASKLELAAAASADLAKYSIEKAKIEGAEEGKWEKTCPNSAGPGPGDISTWRDATGQAAGQNAKRLNEAAVAARAAANRAEKAQTDYSVANHLATMNAIQAEISAIENTITASITTGTNSQNTELITAGSPMGICPDTELVRLASGALKATAFSGTKISFVPPPTPNETVAVHDLAHQLWSIPSGNADLHLYKWYLILSPLMDWVLISMLATLLGPPLRNFHLETIRRHNLPENTTEEQLDIAYQEAARDPQWAALEGNEKIRKRWGILERMYINKNDAAALAHARDLVACSALREGGSDGAGNIVFTLRPHFRPALWLRLVHRSMSSATPEHSNNHLYVIAAE
jgi:hypothetical protein